MQRSSGTMRRHSRNAVPDPARSHRGECRGTSQPSKLIASVADYGPANLFTRYTVEEYGRTLCEMIKGIRCLLEMENLEKGTLVNAPEILAAMRWIFNSGEITVVNVLGENTLFS